MTAPAAPAVSAAAGSSSQFTADLKALIGTSTNISGLAGQSSSTVGDLGKLVLDVLSFAQIGSTVGAANTSLQSSLSQALSKVSTLLQDIGHQVGSSAQGYATADQAVAQSLGASTTAAKPATDGDPLVDKFAASHHQGDSGKDVMEFQRELKQLGYDPGTADGQWGPATQKALQDYQAQHHYVAGAGSGTSIDLPGNLGVVQAPNAQAAAAVRAALSQTGLPYRYGGKNPATGLDCSGLTSWAYRQAGSPIPDGSANQAVGMPVQQADIQPGDLAVWRGSPGHVAMVIGDDKMVEAPHRGAHVHISPVRTSNGSDTFLGFYRPTAPSP
ncbi:MAG: NlpC/P60 family protein [Actinomycetota bacterium]|nr:NlpC/P60 family protein [Actinomycetota bacterium]MDQ2959023.1 NlpC/P60 family protein [Actinomycetota bacterium]